MRGCEKRTPAQRRAWAKKYVGLDTTESSIVVDLTHPGFVDGDSVGPPDLTTGKTMSAKKLTAAEKAWMEKLSAVLTACPSPRLACYTVGDNDLTFYDKNVAASWEALHPREHLDAPDLHRRAGSYLGVVHGPFNIDSCAG